MHDLSGPVRNSAYPGSLAHVFVDTGFIKGTEMGVTISLESGQNLEILGDKVKMDVATNMGIKVSIQEFLILKSNGEALVMGV